MHLRCPDLGRLNHGKLQKDHPLAQCCRNNGIVLNPDKFVFTADTVGFAGFEISPSEVRTCPKLSEAIEKFPTPKNLTDLISSHGLINQVPYTFASADVMQPFRTLLSSKTPFTWTEELDKLFETSKKVIIKCITHWKYMTKNAQHALLQI